MSLNFSTFCCQKKPPKRRGCEGCIFVNDDGSRPVLEELKKQGVKYIALRCAGFNNVDLDGERAGSEGGARPGVLPGSGRGTHAIGMMMSLNRRIHRAYQRTRDANFSLEGLTGAPCTAKPRA